MNKAKAVAVVSEVTLTCLGLGIVLYFDQFWLNLGWLIVML